MMEDSMSRGAVAQIVEPVAEQARANVCPGNAWSCGKSPETLVEYAEEYLLAVRLSVACGQFRTAERIVRKLDRMGQVEAFPDTLASRIDTERAEVERGRQHERVYGDGSLITDHPFNARLREVAEANRHRFADVASG
jgi:hypothetical protein